MDAEVASAGLTLPEVGDLISPEVMIPCLGADAKIPAIKELVDRLHVRGAVRDSLAFLQAVLERENLQSTVVGHGVALPHARSRSVDRLGLALGLAGRPIEYPSGDERHQVRIICLVAVPAQFPVPYLALLASLARSFADGAFRGALLDATTPRELCHLLLSRPFAQDEVA